MRTTLCVAALLAAAPAALAQGSIPLPGFGSTFSSGTLTRGFFFQAPAPFSIVGYDVPDESAFGVQNCELYVFPDASSPGGPPAFSALYTPTASELVFADYGSPVTGQPVNIPPVIVNAGDWVCVLGACGDASTMRNSYATPSGPFNTTLFGQPITLARCGTQNNIVATNGPNPLWSEVNGSLSRVNLYVAPASGFATALPFGNGCGGAADFASYFESFGAGNFDLGGTPGNETVLSHLFAGNGYVILPGAPAWFTPVAANLGLTDDSVSAPQSLGFNLPLPGGASTGSVVIGSNGYVWLDGAANGVDLSPSTAELVSQQARIALCWMDLNPAAGGSVHFDTDPANGAAYVTFVGVPQFGNSAATIDVQLAMFANGNMEVRYGTETMSTGTGTPFVGFSPGNGALVPPASDLSVLPIFTQPDLFIPNLSLNSQRPVEGTTMQINIDNIPAGTALGTLILSATQFNPGIQPFPGLGDCFQHVGLNDVFYYFPSGSSATLNFPVPTGSFTGSVFHSQAVTLSPGINPLGVASSNGLTWTVDVN